MENPFATRPSASSKDAVPVDAWIVAKAMGWALAGGVVVAGLTAWNQWASAMLWAAACSAVGWATGFLFGIPRSLSSDAPAPPQVPDASGVAVRSSVRTNTNLEQISDWLTKIIVGATLVQLPGALQQLYAAAQLVGGEKNIGFGYAVILYFTLTGFLGSYLLTRLFLQRAFDEADGESKVQGADPQDEIKAPAAPDAEKGLGAAAG